MTHKTAKKISAILSAFRFPLLVLGTILLAVIVQSIFHAEVVAKIVLLVVVVVGSIPLFKENLFALFHGKFALDYIALLAIVVGVLSDQYLVAGIIVLMLAGGTTLEEYGTAQAKQSLTALTDRIPNTVLMWRHGAIAEEVKNDAVTVGEEIFVRKGEVIPLDGVLVSETGLTDESSLTGESEMIDKVAGDQVRSGTVNIGEGIAIRVTKVSKDSTYWKIIEMVKKAQAEKAPLIRLADKYSGVFTVITLMLAATAYAISHDFTRVLAVLVIATPCPLILATPIALMGGMNAAAKRRIILKKLSSIEVLSRVDTIIFDKTGTLTFGKPFVKKVIVLDDAYTEEQLSIIAAAIERNSLHPLAKAIVNVVAQRRSREAGQRLVKHAHNVSEKTGTGISGEVDGVTYTLSKVKDFAGMAIQISHKHTRLGIFEFEDKIKANSKEIIAQLKKLGLELYIFTGDKQAVADEVAQELGGQVTVKAECTPEDKRDGIQTLKRQGKITAMIGDGINDAPALASADVGIVFSNEEQTAASEAADIIFLAGDFSAVMEIIDISKRTIHIALQSILFGIGISIVGMIFAATGLIVPIAGAFLQEIIDILVIFNALRASRLK